LLGYIFDFIEKNANITLLQEEKNEIMPKVVEIFEKLKNTLFKSFFTIKKGASGSK